MLFPGLSAVKKRYKRLCTLHPDKNLGNVLAAEAFAIVSAAYADLSTLLAPAAAAGAVAGPLHATQPAVQQQANRWQAFTGWRHPKQQQAAPPAAQHPHPRASPQENRTPGNDCGGGEQQQQGPVTAGACGSWQGSRWGKQAGTALFRAQPVAAAPAAPCAASGLDSSTRERQQRTALSSKRHGSRRSSLSSCSLSFDSGSDDSGSEDAAFAANRRQTRACVQSAAFYGSGSLRCSPGDSSGTAAAANSKGPAASLYGLFTGRRSSAGQAGGWLGSQQPTGAADRPKWSLQQTQPRSELGQPAQQQEQQQQLAPPLLWQQASAQPFPPLGSLQEHAQQGGHPARQPTSPQADFQHGSQPSQTAAGGWAGQAGSRWDSDRSKLHLLKRPGGLAVPAAGGSDGSQPAVNEERVQQKIGRCSASGRSKRQHRVLSSSSDESSSGGERQGESNSDEGVVGACGLWCPHGCFGVRGQLCGLQRILCSAQPWPALSPQTERVVRCYRLFQRD